MKQPKNKKLTAAQKEFKIEVNLAWNNTFGKDMTDRFTTAQKFVDSECIRLMSKYTPARNLLLSKSAIIGTKIGSGHIVYASPYARYQYYGVVYGPNIPIYENGEIVGFYSPPKKHSTGRKMRYSKVKHPQAQRLWFETMKAKHGGAILRGAAAIAGGKAK